MFINPPYVRAKARVWSSFSRINFRCNLGNSADQVSPRVVLWKGRPAGAITTQIFSSKSHSSSINYWPSVRIRSRSLARSLPEPPFTLALSAGVIIPTNCRLDVLGQWGHSIALTILFQWLIFILRSRVNVASSLRSIQTQQAVNIWGIIKEFRELGWFMEELTPSPSRFR